jgi:hypothetical protein
MNVFEIQKSPEGNQLFAGIMRDIQFRKSLRRKSADDNGYIEKN